MVSKAQEKELRALYHRTLERAQKGRECVLFGDSSHRHAQRVAARQARRWGWSKGRLSAWSMAVCMN